MDSGPPFVGSPAAQIRRMIADIKRLCAPGQTLDQPCSSEQLRQAAHWNGPDGILVYAAQAKLLTGDQAEALRDALNRLEVSPSRGRQAVCRLVHYLYRQRKYAPPSDVGPWPTTALPLRRRERVGYFVS